jgi:hypothetical protein
MTPSDLEKAKTLVLDYHRKVPNNDPRFAASLVGTSCINSLDVLDAAYAELLKAGELEAVRIGCTIDEDTGQKFDGSFYRCRPPPVSERPAGHRSIVDTLRAAVDDLTKAHTKVESLRDELNTLAGKFDVAKKEASGMLRNIEAASRNRP